MSFPPQGQPSQRQLRVGEEIRHGLASVLERQEVRDPELSGLTLTVTEVRVSADLRQATVFVLPLGGAGAEHVIPGLKRAKGFLKHRLGEAVRLKFVPDLHFKIDESFDQATRIDALLRDPMVARDLAGPETEEGSEA